MSVATELVKNEERQTLALNAARQIIGQILAEIMVGTAEKLAALDTVKVNALLTQLTNKKREMAALLGEYAQLANLAANE